MIVGRKLSTWLVWATDTPTMPTTPVVKTIKAYVHDEPWSKAHDHPCIKVGRHFVHRFRSCEPYDESRKNILSDKFLEFPQVYRIQWKFLCRYTPQQNGVAKRKRLDHTRSGTSHAKNIIFIILKAIYTIKEAQQHVGGINNMVQV